MNVREIAVMESLLPSSALTSRVFSTTVSIVGQLSTLELVESTINRW